MKQSRRSIAGTLVAASMLLLAGSALADGAEDIVTQFNQQRYFNLQQNARTIGMAGSSVATSSDSSSVLGNPAGLGFMKDAEVSAAYARNNVSGKDVVDYGDIEQEIDEGHALIALPINPTLDGTPEYGNFGFGWSGSKSTADDSLDTDTKGHALTFAYGKDIDTDVTLGYGISVIQDKVSSTVAGSDIADDLENGVKHTVGAQIKTDKDTTVGLATSYGLGNRQFEVNSAEIPGDEEEDVSSWGAEAGVGHQMGTTLLAASTDYANYRSSQDDDSYAWGFKAGIEEALTDWLKGRLGYRYQANFGYDVGLDNDNAKFNAFALGVGVELAKNLFADYGAEYRAIGDGDWLHSVTLSVPFSLCAD